MNSRNITLATVQFAMSQDLHANLETAKDLVHEAAKEGAQLILLPELFYLPYFCKIQNEKYFDLAHAVHGNPILKTMSTLARKLKVVLPISFFEYAAPCYFNALTVIDSDGEVLEVYRKSHVPDGPGYQEKFYFSPGDTGFKVWSTHIGNIGAAICWDQWFPEAARILALKGAEMICYPTAIGSEPHNALLDSRHHWQTVMQGHAGANMLPVLAANRIGRECDEETCVDFYGSSFITNHLGEIVSESPRNAQAIGYASINLVEIAHARRSWGIFRDRRPDLYHAILGLEAKSGS